MKQEGEIRRLKDTTRLQSEKQKEERMRQEKEIGQLKEITRLQIEEQERTRGEKTNRT